MSVAVNLYYYGENGTAKKFVEEMTSTGLLEAIRAEPGSIHYGYFFPADEPETALLIEVWEDENAFTQHCQSPALVKAKALWESYGFRLKAERYKSDDTPLP